MSQSVVLHVSVNVKDFKVLDIVYVSQSVVLHVSVNVTDFKVLDIVYASQSVHSLLVSVNVMYYSRDKTTCTAQHMLDASHGMKYRIWRERELAYFTRVLV